MYDIPSVATLVEISLIGKVISLSCHFLGRFMPYFFAGRLESGNVCEYIIMMRRFQRSESPSTTKPSTRWGSKRPTVYFQEVIADAAWLPYFGSSIGAQTRASMTSTTTNRFRPKMQDDTAPSIGAT